MTPEPGMYPGVPMHEYHAWEAVSNSQLSRLARTPAHLRAYLTSSPKETTAMVLGRAAHAAILEPEEFEVRYRRMSWPDKRTKAGKAEWEKLCAEVGAEYVLRPADYDACLGMREAVHCLRRAHGLISGNGQVELSCAWNDKRTGILCKGRMDRHSPEIADGAIVDLKTTKDASRRSFERTIFRYGYHRQAALYLRGAQALGLAARHYAILAMEKESPYATAVYRLTEPVVEAGDRQLDVLLDRYAQCVRQDAWPAFPDKVMDVALPDWAWGVIDEDIKEAVA